MHWSMRSMAAETRLFPPHDPANVGGLRAAASPQQDLPVVARPSVRRQGTRYRRPLPIPTEPSLVSIDEKPDSGTRSRAAGLADDARRDRAPGSDDSNQLSRRPMDR